MENEMKTSSGSTRGTRIFAFAALAAFVSGVGYVGKEAYRAATDSFVAPIILSPDSDVVLSNKLKMSELLVERARTAAQVDAIDADVSAAAKAIGRLEALKWTTSNALAWTEGVNRRQASAVSAEMKVLGRQKAALQDLLAQQEKLAAQARANMEAGLISKMDYAKEEQAAGRWQVALIETDRTQLQAQLLSGEVAFAHKSLSQVGPAMPEQIVREEQMVRIELEVMKLEAEQRSKVAEKKVLQQKLATIDELDAQLKGRPIFRAMDHSMDVAFVPYTQIEGLKAGASVYDCVWGIFHCKAVGTVAELVPGEVVLPDPWGNQSRGQYAVLDLSAHESAKSKTLRVRGAASAPVARAATTSDRVVTVK